MRWSNEFEENWELVSSPEEEAAALFSFDRRLSVLCDAIRHREIPADLVVHINALRESLRLRHTWTTLAITDVLCCDSARTLELSVGRISTHAYAVEAVLRIESELEVGNADLIKSDFETFGLRFSTDPGWNVFDIRGSIIGIAPSYLQLSGPEGVGTERWQYGTAFRVRRLRVPGDIDLAQTVSRFSHLPGLLGDVVSERNTSLLGQKAKVWSVDSAGDWQFEIFVSLVGEYAIIVDYGCPKSSSEWCSVLNESVDRIELIAS